MELRYRFGRFELQPDRRQLLDAGRPTTLGARAFDLLLILIERRDRLVTKAELLETAWPGAIVEEANLSVQVSALRKVVGPTAITTVPGRGYRFTALIDGDDPAGEALPAPDSAAASATHGNVPAECDTLIGRDAEVGEVMQWIDAHRLVTLVGPGGIGKTRLATAVARSQLGRHLHGVWWVDLAALSLAAQVVPTIAAAVRIQLGDDLGDASQRLARTLRPLQFLLILDNCEHMAAAVAVTVNTLLEAAPGLKILATSQEALKVPGEHLFSVEPMALPPPGTSLAVAREFGALRLLEQRVRAADPRFSLSQETLASSIELCRRLDGIALAIEMAAARLPQLGLHGLLARLDDRFDLLRTAHRTSPGRQQTLRATLEWSHAMLDADEQLVLRRLAVFAGSFSPEAAQHTVSFDRLDECQVLDGLARLVEKSFVRLERIEPPRYRLAETTRLFAQERLDVAGELQAAQARHGQTMVWIAAPQAQRHMTEAQWLARIGPEYDDLALAFERASHRGDAETAAAVIGALRSYDHVRGVLVSTRPRVEAAYRLLPLAGGVAKARLLNFIASCGWIDVEHGSRVDAAREAARLSRALGRSDELIHALCLLATESARVGAFDDAETALSEVRGMETADSPPLAAARRAAHEGWVRWFASDLPRYRIAMRELLALARVAGAPRMAAFALEGLANAALVNGELIDAIELSRDAAREAEALGNSLYHADALRTLCIGLMLGGDLDGARLSARRAIVQLERCGVADGLIFEVALLAALSRHWRHAALLLGHCEVGPGASGEPRGLLEPMLVRRTIAILQTAIGQVELTRLQAEGRTLSAGAANSLVEDVLAGAVRRASQQPSTSTGD